MSQPLPTADLNVLTLLTTGDNPRPASEFNAILLKLADAGFIIRNSADDGWQLSPTGQAMLDKTIAARH